VVLGKPALAKISAYDMIVTLQIVTGLTTISDPERYTGWLDDYL
jgi:hypothetical protein